VEQKQIRTLSAEVGTGLQYYAYLEPITRRLNAPGASSVIGDDGFVEMLTNLDACIEFMIKHVSKTFYCHWGTKMSFSKLDAWFSMIPVM